MIDLIVLGGFLALLTGIGKWASGRVHTSEDFHLCGRSLRKWPVALSLAATEFNGSGLVGGAGLAYSIGLAGVYWNYAAVPAWILLGFTVAVAFRKLSLYTVPEFLGNHYGERARVLASVSQLLSSTIFIAVQILVSALTLSTLLGLPREITAVVVTLGFVLYTFAGGLLAVVWTDVVCYFVLMIAVVIAVPLAWTYVDGWDGLRQALPPERFDLTTLGVMEPLAWVALCFYSYGTDQAYLQRVFAAKNPEIARFAYVYTGLNYLVFGGAVALLGLTASVLVPDLAAHDEAFPALISRVFPEGLRSLFLTAILAATMSTASSYLSASSSLFVKDIYERHVRSSASDEKLLLISRLSIFVVAALALGVALGAPRIVDAVVLSVIVYHSAVFFPVLFAMYDARVHPKLGFWSILVGGASGLVSHFFIYQRVAYLGEIHPLFFGPVLSILVLLSARKAASV